MKLNSDGSLDLNDEATVNALAKQSIQAQEKANKRSEEEILAEKKAKAVEKGGRFSMTIDADQIQRIQRMGSPQQTWKEILQQKVLLELLGDANIGRPIISRPSQFGGNGNLVTGPSKKFNNSPHF